MLTHRNTSPVRPSRALILGAGGFLTPEIVRVLKEDSVNVRAIGSKDIDLTAADAGTALSGEVRQGDVVVMVAALTPDKGRDVKTLMANLRMAESVCAALANVRAEQFVYISSDSVYDARSSSLLNEESSCEPLDLYALAHIAREKMLEAACSAAGIRFTIVRPCAIYGARDTHNSYGPNRFIRTAHKDGKIKLFGGGEEKRHHIYVTDVAKLVYLCILHGSTGVINAVSGEAISFGELAERIAASVGAHVAIERLPRTGPITHRHFDTIALTKAFPDFKETSLENGLARSVEGMALASS